jgi:hypothetical protein
VRPAGRGRASPRPPATTHGELAADAQPLRNRKKEKTQTLVASALRPVRAEYIRIVSSMVLARPIRSPKMPKIRPPIAQPRMKIVVA